MDSKRLASCVGFEWDDGNLEKNRTKHGVEWWEAEEIFLNEPLVVVEDERHSGDEPRSYALGKTHLGRLLFVVFTIRGPRIRVISARDTSRRERREYSRHEEEDPHVPE